MNKQNLMALMGWSILPSGQAAGKCEILLNHYWSSDYWSGAATTYCQIEPKERLVAIAFAQLFPFNEHGFFAAFQTGYYQALK